MTSTRDRYTVSLFVTVTVAAIMLWAAEGPYSQASLTVPVAVAAFFVAERQGRVLGNIGANVLGLIAIGASLIELWLRDIEGRLLFGAHLLVYLTWILLWMPKLSRQRWGLITLAVLQVGVGSVLTNNGLYGLSMAAFLTLCVWTLVLHQLDEAESHHSPVAAPVPRRGVARPLDLMLLGRGSVSTVGTASFGQWPLRQVAAAVAVTVVAAIAVGSAFFLLIPRYEIGRRGFTDDDSPLARQRLTGFTDRVRLGEMGQILESSVPVFDVRLFDESRDAALDVETYTAALGYEEPLFRGIALETYERGSWSATEKDDFVFMQGTRGRSNRLVRQEYHLQAIATDTIFGIAPIFAGQLLGGDDSLRIRSESREIIRPQGRRYAGEVNYVLFSPRDPRQLIGSDDEFGPPPQRASLLSNPAAAETYRELPDNLPRLRLIAARVARDGGDAPPAVRAKRLLAYLRDSGEYSYSLNIDIRDSRLDPVEDFLLNQKSGHCEYFASALALMLRSEGIPCRLISGFKGGEVNRLSQAFEVQQRHAHTWVEALIDGSWRTLDPTPATARAQSVAENAAALPILSDFMSAASGFWRNYVVQMSLSRQQRTLAPLRAALLSLANSGRDVWWPALKRQAYALATDPSRWISWQGGVATFLLLLLAVAAWGLCRAIAARVRRAREVRRDARRRGRRVEFYERFRRLCARQRWLPAPGQTPREFAREVSDSLASRNVPAHLAAFPGTLAEQFYEVRFGECDLTDDKARQIADRLAELENALVAER